MTDVDTDTTDISWSADFPSAIISILKKQQSLNPDNRRQTKIRPAAKIDRPQRNSAIVPEPANMKIIKGIRARSTDPLDLPKTSFKQAGRQFETILGIRMNRTDSLIITIDDGTHRTNISATPNFNGLDIPVMFIAVDDSGASDADTTTISILPRNDPLVVIHPIPDVTFAEDSGSHTIADLDTVFYDLDLDVLEYTSYFIGDSIGVSLSGSILEISTVQDSFGQYSVWAGATDGEFSVRDTFVVIIIPVNDPPSLSRPIPDSEFSEDSGSHIIADLDTVFYDLDLDALNFSAEFAADSIGLNLNESILEISTVQDVSGTFPIRATANDGEFSVSDTFVVTLTAVNDPPVVDLPLIEFVEDSYYTADLDAFVWDVDHDS
ncbi:MAG: hypothetical protein GY869_19205, partial [Planctomycetes bacterium]|nr:hypothetical protein [Planctomycetota bacterium]